MMKNSVAVILLFVTYVNYVATTGGKWTVKRCYIGHYGCQCYLIRNDRGSEDRGSDWPRTGVSFLRRNLRKCRESEMRCKRDLRKARDDLSNSCDSKSNVKEETRRKLEMCNRRLREANENLNTAVIQNVRTTIADLATETRLCIRLNEADCREQSSTCVWDPFLTVSGMFQRGACLSARFE